MREKREKRMKVKKNEKKPCLDFGNCRISCPELLLIEVVLIVGREYKHDSNFELKISLTK